MWVPVVIQISFNMTIQLYCMSFSTLFPPHSTLSRLKDLSVCERRIVLGSVSSLFLLLCFSSQEIMLHLMTLSSLTFTAHYSWFPLWTLVIMMSKENIGQFHVYCLHYKKGWTENSSLLRDLHQDACVSFPVQDLETCNQVQHLLDLFPKYISWFIRPNSFCLLICFKPCIQLKVERLS